MVPTLSAAGINDGDADNLVKVDTLLTYTVTFSEDIDATTVTAADFTYRGSSGLAKASVYSSVIGTPSTTY